MCQKWAAHHMSLGKIPGNGYIFTDTLHVKDLNLNGGAKVHETKIWLHTETLEMLIMFCC